MKRSFLATTLMPLVAAASLVAGCTASATPSATLQTVAPTPAAPSTASPTVRPTPSPSPTPPADVTQEFLAQVLGQPFEAGGPVTGSLSLGSLQGTISGSMAISGKSSAVVIQIDVPGIMSTSTAQITVDGRQYESQNGGPWFEVKASTKGSGQTASSGLAASFATAMLTIKDEGVVSKQGQRLHHMVPGGKGVVTAADLGFTDSSMADATGRLEFYARDDGSLAVMSISLAWTASAGGATVPASMIIDFAFDADDRTLIAPPDQVWTTYVSKRFGYSVGYPTDWQLHKAASDTDWDLFVVAPTQFAAAARDRLPKSAAGDLAAYVKAYIATEKKTSKATPETSQAVTFLGADAWQLTYHRTVDGEDLYSVHTLFVRGRNAYQVFVFGPTGYESEIDAFHDLQLSTFKLAGA